MKATRNCTHHADGRCGLGVKNGRPAPRICEACELRIPRDDGPAAVYVPLVVKAKAVAPYNGAHEWAWLHAYCRDFSNPIATFSAAIAALLRRLPCGECRQHAAAWIAANPPDFSHLFGWSVRFHNSVNARLRKPQMPLDEARKLYTPPSA